MKISNTIKAMILAGSLAVSITTQAQQMEGPRIRKAPERSSAIEKQVPKEKEPIRMKDSLEIHVQVKPQKLFPVKVTTEPASVTFYFETNLPTSAHIELGRRAPDEVPEFRSGDRIGILLPSYPVQEETKHTFKTQNLKPATLYYYIVKVPGNDGTPLTATGFFTTPIRFD